MIITIMTMMRSSDARGKKRASRGGVSGGPQCGDWPYIFSMFGRASHRQARVGSTRAREKTHRLGSPRRRAHVAGCARVRRRVRAAGGRRVFSSDGCMPARAGGARVGCRSWLSRGVAVSVQRRGSKTQQDARRHNDEADSSATPDINPHQITMSVVAGTFTNTFQPLNRC